MKARPRLGRECGPLPTVPSTPRSAEAALAGRAKAALANMSRIRLVQANPESARPLAMAALRTGAAAVLVVFALFSGLLAASELPAAAERCLGCHDDPAVNGLLHGPHAVLSDPRNRFAEEGCASCHGPSEAHLARPPRGEPRARTDVEFAKGEAGAAGTGVCIDCHRGSAGLHWTGSAHADAGLACTDCHQVHAVQDPMQCKRPPTPPSGAAADVLNLSG